MLLGAGQHHDPPREAAIHAVTAAATLSALLRWRGSSCAGTSSNEYRHRSNPVLACGRRLDFHLYHRTGHGPPAGEGGLASRTTFACGDAE